MAGGFWGAFLLLVAAAAAPGVAHAEAPGRRGDVDEPRSVAAIRGSRVFVDGKVVYRGAPRERLISSVAWSAPGDAIAFATRDRGQVQLVVVLVSMGMRVHVMRWPVPPRRVAGKRASVTWLGPRRVSLGRDRLQPAVVASWKVSR